MWKEKKRKEKVLRSRNDLVLILTSMSRWVRDGNTSIEEGYTSHHEIFSG